MPGQGGAEAVLIDDIEKRSLTMSWEEKDNPYFACILDESFSLHESRVSFEPMNGRFDTLEEAFKNGTARMVEPGETDSWKISIDIGGEE